MARPVKLPGGGLRFHGWELTSQSKKPIMKSVDMDKFGEQLELPALPEEVYGENFLKLKLVKTGAEIGFNALDALKLVDAKNDLVKVAYADEWAAGRDAQTSEFTIQNPYDWTFTSSYKGTFDKSFKFSDTLEPIDLEALKKQEPILFYDCINMYGDDFGDNGAVMLNVRVRAMPSSFFVLQRLFVRVDHVIVRVIETRLYHRFGTNYLIREYNVCESSESELEKKIGAQSKLAYREEMINTIVPHLKVLEVKNEKVEF